MAFSTYTDIIKKACNYNISHGYNQLSIIYHGGEPLLWGYQNFVDAIKFQEDLCLKNPNLKFRNSIQTNGSLLNREWIDFFKEHCFNVGISIDGPNDINFHKSHAENHIVLDNIHLMTQLGCRFGILTVITDQHEGWADKYYDFLVENNIHSVGFCYCIYDEENHITVNNKILTDFLTQFFKRYYYGKYRLNVREFENAMRICLGKKASLCTFSNRKNCGNYFSIKPNGDVQFCDPFSLDKPSIGNILIEDFYSIKSKPSLTDLINVMRYSSGHICEQCEIKNICGGGCSRHLLPDGSNLFCETFKSIYPIIADIIRQYRQ